MAVQRLFLLPMGRLRIDRSAFDTRREPGSMTDIPIWAYLVETTDGPVLVDTGMPGSFASDPEGIFRGTPAEGRFIPEMSEDDTILRVLARAGYQPRDLAFLVSTHWHFDHAGENRSFPETEIVVQRAERDAARDSDQYFDFCKDPALRYRLVEGDSEPVPGLRLLHTPGHTPGHQSVLVRTPDSGAILLTVDASYVRENYEDGVPFAVADPALAAHSIARLKDIAKEERARVFFGHDAAQGATLRSFPLAY